MVIKVECLDQLMLEFDKSFVNERNITYYDYNKILELLNEEVTKEWKDTFSISTALTISYRENDKGEQMESSCIFLLREFKRGNNGNDDVNYTYEYNGTVS